MKKLHYLLTLFCLLAVARVSAKEISVTFLDLGLTGTNLVEMSPIQLNTDIQLVFEQGSALLVPSYKASNGRVTLTMGSVVKVIGRADDVVIKSISFTSPKASNTFSAGAAECLPEGTFTIDKSDYTSTWSSEQGSNSVQITNTTGAPVLTAVAVTYTGGQGGSEGPGTDPDPVEPDPVIETTNQFVASFATQAEFDAMTVINVDESTYAWRYDRSLGAVYIRNEFGSTAALPKDDYLVTPALALKAGHYYRLSFAAWNGSAPYPERIGAYLGTKPEAASLTQSVVPPVLLEGKDRTDLGATFTVPADGDYYAALHASSDPGMFIIYADDFVVSRGVLPTAPAEVTDFRAVPDKTGALKVSLALTVPALDMAGSPLASVKSVTLYRDGVQIAVKEAAPGAEVTYDDTVTAEGTYTYTAVVEGEHGPGFDAVTRAWVGSAAPLSPEQLQVEETAPGVLKFTWTPVTANVHGHEIDPSAVTYVITVGGSSTVVAEGLTGSEAVVNYPAEGEPQVITDFTIKAVTAGGRSASGAVTPIVAVGEPYAMPYAETFPGGSLTPGQTAQIIADENHAPGCWGYYEMLVLDEILPVKPDGGLAAFFPYADGDCSTWRSAKIAIDADAVNPCLSFYYYTIPGATDRLTVDIDGTELTELTIAGDERGWHEALVPLSAYKGRVVRISITGYSVNSNNKICIDDIAVRDEPTVDMAITRARIPQQILQGASHRCSIRVTNLGVNTSGNYTITVTDGDTEVWSVAATALERGAEAEYTFDLAYGSFDAESALYTVTLTCAGDENPADNEVQTSAVFTPAELPAPAGIRVEAAATGNLISWDAVSFAGMPARQITEGFESYDEFVCDSAGEWSFIDGDGCNVLGIRDGYHAYPNMYSPMAFMVFNNHDGFFPQIGTMSFLPYEGGQCLMSASVDVINGPDRANDDYLISPRLSGAPQTISFYARSSGRVFPEDICVMASSTDRLASSFVKIADFEKLPHEWTRYEAELPAGTLYFAICNRSYDQNMLFIDNISFEAAPVETTVEGYDVYVGDADNAAWHRLNDSPVAETSLAVDALDADATLRVAARYANGCVAFSEPVSVKWAGIDIIAADSETAEPAYFDLRGVRLDSRPTAPGIYIMRRGTEVTKLLVK